MKIVCTEKLKLILQFYEVSYEEKNMYLNIAVGDYLIQLKIFLGNQFLKVKSCLWSVKEILDT